MTLNEVYKFVSDNTLLIIIGGIGYILAWVFVFYTGNVEIAKLLVSATVGFLFGKVKVGAVYKFTDRAKGLFKR
jgi:hypothetical protein